MKTVSSAAISPEDFEHVSRAARTHHPSLVPWLEKLGRIEIGESPHPTVCDQLFVEVVNQQLSAKAADSILRRLLGTAGSLGIPLRVFLGGSHNEKVRSCGLSRNKARTLEEIVKAEGCGLLDTDELRSMPHILRSQRLTAIWGIGQWTADMVGIFHFQDADIWPDGDIAVVGTMRKLTGVTTTTEAASHYAPLRSLLARYLWRIRDTVETL